MKIWHCFSVCFPRPHRLKARLFQKKADEKPVQLEETLKSKGEGDSQSFDQYGLRKEQ